MEEDNRCGRRLQRPGKRILEMFNQHRVDDDSSVTTTASTAPFPTTTTQSNPLSSLLGTQYQSHSLPAYQTRDKSLLSSEEYQRGPVSTRVHQFNIQTNNKDNPYLNDQQKCNTLQQFDKMAIDFPWNYTVDEMKEEEAQELNSITDPLLSQKMSPLPTNTSHDHDTAMEEMKAVIKKIPNYLTNQNISFQQMIQYAKSIIQTTATTTNKIEELQKIATVIYKIMVIQTYHLLWTAYLRSGQGQLMIPCTEQPSYLVTVPIWSKEIKSLLQLSNKINANEIYLTFVKQHLHELDHQLNICKTELNIKANNILGYSLTIQKIIETYIEQHLQSFRLKIEHQIELIHHDYHIRALKLEYFRHNPNKYQVQLMKEICQSKYEQETTEQESNFLKQQIDYYNSPSQSFERSPIAQTTLIDSIQNTDIRQQLFNEYKDIAVQSRASLFYLYLKTAEDQREEYKKKYEENVKKMQTDDQFINQNPKMSLIMIQIINQRCEKISERIRCLYTFKAQSTLSESPQF